MNTKVDKRIRETFEVFESLDCSISQATLELKLQPMDLPHTITIARYNTNQA
jgi:hypothetical protein